jgi:hypothetical protein
MTHLPETIEAVEFEQTSMADEAWKAITKEHLQGNKKRDTLIHGSFM